MGSEFVCILVNPPRTTGEAPALTCRRQSTAPCLRSSSACASPHPHASLFSRAHAALTSLTAACPVSRRKAEDEEEESA